MLIGLATAIGGGRSGGGSGSNTTTLSPVWKHADFTYSNGNLTATQGGGNLPKFCGSIDAKASGEYYFEVTINSFGSGAPYINVGVGNWRAPVGGADGTYLGQNTHSVAYGQDGGIRYNGATVISTGTFTTGDVICVHVNAATGQVRFRKNGGAWTSYTALAGGGPYQPMVGTYYSGAQVTCNFGASPFAQSPPAGTSGWARNPTLSGRYLRFFHSTGNNNNSHIAEIVARLTSGGANQFGSGTASASSSWDSNYLPPKAVDGNVATLWHSSDNGGPDSYWQYDFGSGNIPAIGEIAMTVQNVNPQWPISFRFLASSDLTTFYPYGGFYTPTWTLGETKTFTFTA